MRKHFLLILALCATIMAWGEDKSITERYVNAGTGASASRVSFKSSFDENFTVWQRGGRSKTTDVVSIGGQDVKGFWLSRQTSSSCYIEWGETNKQYLGGVKSVSFAYKQFGSEANHTMILDVEVNGEQVDRISFPAGTSPYPTYTYSKDLNAKKLTKLTIRNSSTATEGTTVNGRFVVGPVTITPYLYCPSSAQNVQYKVSESATYINPDFIDNTEGEATWSCAPEGIVTIANGVVTPIEGKSGNVVITAKLNDIEVSYNLEVIVKTKSTPEISFEKEAITITNLYTTEPVENKLTVTEGAGSVTYTSSNPLVGKVVGDKVMVVGAGTATITATAAENEDYVSASASYALTVNEPEGEAAVSEDFDGKLPLATSYQTEPVNFTDQDSLYFWTVNGHRYDGTWVRFATNENACMTSQGVQEGGVKRLSFTWKRANGECAKIHTTIKALDGDGNEIVDRSIELAGSEDQTSNQTYNMRFDEVMQNAQFYLRNESDGFVILISDIKIVPYVLYTEKAQTANAADETYDATTGLINNAPEGEVTFSIVTEDAQATIDEATGVIDMSKVTISEDIVIRASYEDAYTTMNLHVNALPVPTVSFADGDAVEKDMNTIGYVNTLTRDGDGAVSYESSDETVATVSNEGVITIIGEGVTTITAKVDACQTYTAAEASYELTITDPEDDAYVETFDKLPDETKSSTSDRTGDWYTWKITTGARHKTTDILFNGTRALWLAGNGGASMETTIEGGIKRVSFLWNKFSANPTSISLDVTAGEVTRSLTKAVTSGENQNDPDLVFNSNFGVKSNAKLKIANPQNTTALQIGPIAITPYIFYTVKDTTIDMTKFATFTNDKLIDNRDDEVAIVYSIVGENDGVASINAQTGEVTASKAGTITVQAKWGDVTTTYMLTIKTKGDVDAKFATEGKVEKELANGSFTNAVVVTAGDAIPAYESDNTNVAEVDAEGKVTIKAIGTATITATMAETDNYFAWEDSYTVVVRTGVAADNKLVEHFTQMPKGLITTEGGDEVEGDIDITWLAYSTRRGDNDTIGGAGVQGNNIFTKGYIKSQAAVEGGIKYFSLNWKQWATENNCTLKLRAKLGESEFSMEKAGTGLATYEHYFFAINAGIKSNVGIALYNESYNEDGPLASNGRITFDAFEIVPYLYYKTKSHTIENAIKGATYTNTDLINNIDNNEGTITYSLISDGAGDIAGINAETGEVTVKAGGAVTVQAKWVADATKQDEFVSTTYELTINFPQPTITFNNIEVALDGTITPSITVMVGDEDVTETATITYEVADKNIADWDVTDGWNVIGIGTTTITANVAGTTTYGPASKTADIEVTNITPADGTYWKETFSSKEGPSSYDISLNTIEGDNNVLKWKARNFQRSTSDDKVGSEQGIRISQKGRTVDSKTYSNPGYVEYYTDNEGVSSQEGGIKYVQFQWRIPGTSDDQKVVFDVKYKEGSKTITRTLTYTGVAHETVYDYAQNFNLKNNNKLTIAGSTDSDQPVIIGPITIVPYLLYTEKIVSVTYDLEGTNEVDVTANLINNLEEGETVTYSLSEGAQATIDGSIITLANATEDVIVTATCGDVSTTFTLKVTAAEDPEPEPDFVLENKTAGAISTICLPNKIDRIENATLYSINYGNTQEIEFVEADFENDAAGMPYLVQVTADGDVNFYYSEGDAVTEPVDAQTAKGFVGSLSDSDIDVPSNGTAILISGGQLHIAGVYCVLTTNHAYISTTYLPETATPSSAPRRTIRLYNPNAAPTGLGQWNKDKGQRTMKVIENGQFRIVRDGKTYNAQGIEL